MARSLADSGRGLPFPRCALPFRLAARACFLLLLFAVGSLAIRSGRGQDESALGTSAPAQDWGDASESVGPYLLAFAILLGISAMASASETAIFSLTKIDVMQARKQSSRGSRALIYLLDHPNDTLTTILVLNTLVHVGLSLAAGALSELFFSGFTVRGLTLAAFGATAVILVFGEVIPKCVAHIKADILAPIVSWPIAIVAYLLTPFRILMNALIRWVFRELKVPEERITDRVSGEELKAMISAGDVKTILEEDEREMIHGVFDLNHTFAEEIMIPRGEVAALPDTISQEGMLAALRESKFKRIPIYRDNLDHLLGFVLVKEVLLNPQRPWRESLRALLCVPARVRLFDLLTRFRREAIKIAALVDEYGGVAGIVTLHNLLEEIVGDIADRHEPVVDEFQTLGERRFRVRGEMNLHDLGRELGIDFPEDLGNTVGGFVMNMLGSVPVVGKVLAYNGLNFKVIRMTGRRIAQLEITRETGLEGAPAGAVPEGLQG